MTQTYHCRNCDSDVDMLYSVGSGRFWCSPCTDKPNSGEAGATSEALLEADALIIKAMELACYDPDVFAALQQARREVTQSLNKIAHKEGK